MKTRAILYCITLLAYTLSLAHSVIPHHHHESAEEARSHTHSEDNHHTHDQGKIHHHGNEKSNHESHESGHFFFFTHDSNADVLLSHSDIAKPIKGKKLQVTVPSILQLTSFEISEHLVFHPPQSDIAVSFDIFSSRPLRAPPSFIA